ncbi:MAG: PAS domain S-box protein [Candidatus Sumerlaeia bacterium]
MKLARASSLTKDGLPQRLAWVPIPVMLGTMIWLWARDSQQEYIAPAVAMAMNFFCKTVVSVLIAWLVGRSFLVSGQLGLLFLGCGVGIWGTISLITAGGLTNLTVTINNTGALASGLCHLMGGMAVNRGKMTRSSGMWLATGYIVAMTVIGLITYAATEGWLPEFYVEGRGGTWVRHLVLGSAVAMFILTAILLRVENEGSHTSFPQWYAYALLLVATGMMGTMIESSRYSALCWAARLTQNVGGIYMLIAVIASVRETGQWGISLSDALRESEERFRLFMDNSPTIAWIKDEAGRHLYINKTYADRFQIRLDDIRGKTDNELEAPERAALCRSKDVEAMAAGRPIEYPDQYQNPDGTVGDWHVIKFPFNDSAGERYVAGIGLDVTERKRAEEKLKELNRSLEERVHERTRELKVTVQQLQALAQRLTQAEEQERGRLAEILHDDLQQILVAMKMYLGRISLKSQEDGALGELIKRTDNLLDEAIQKTRKLSHELSPPYFSQQDLVDSIRWLCGQMKTKHDMTIRLMADEEIEVEDAVKVFLFRAAQELLFNTVKHAGVRDAQIDIHRNGRNVELTVSDNGNGFDPGRIGGNGGGGLGLFSIQERIRVMGGCLIIDSAPGLGSRFKMSVPLKSQRAAVTAADVAEAQTEMEL